MDARHSGGGSPRLTGTTPGAGRHSTLARRASLLLAALALAALALAARADGFVYWSNNFGTIASANLDGTTANPSLVSVGAQVQVHGLAVDGARRGRLGQQA